MRVYLAIAVNEVIRVVTRTYEHEGAMKFSGLIPEEWLKAGENRVEVYRIIEDHSGGGGSNGLQP